MDRSDLANRMKEYEKRNRYYLQRRMPVIIRLDMRAGHTFTQGFQRPFDEVFMKSMQETAKYLCENVQNAKAAYVQSDEITLLLIDYEKIHTDVFFDYRVDKLCSITASMATMAFNKFFELASLTARLQDSVEENGYELGETYKRAMNSGAMFDARVFNIPKEEVTNNFYWRQLDASRNSIQMVGQANFSHKELHKKTCNMIQDMLMTQKGINWNDLPTYQKRGSCVIKEEYLTRTDGNGETFEVSPEDVGTGTDDITIRTRWIIDTEMPLLKGKDREYIDRLVMVGE